MRPHRAKTLALVATVLAAGCGPAPTEDSGTATDAIINAPSTTLNAWTVLAWKLGGACNASLLSPHWLVTSAHCIDVSQPTVRIEGFGVTLYDGSARAYIHPDYDGEFGIGSLSPSDTDDDVALIEIYGAGIALTQYARVGVPADLETGERITIVSAGFGSEPGQFPSCDEATFGTRRTADYALKTVEWEKLEIDWGDHEICPGDSGSPWSVPIDGRHSVLSVTANRRPWHDADSCHLRAKLPWFESATAGRLQALTCPTYEGAARDFVECFEPPMAVTALAAGREHACATLADMSLRCWGRGTERQLGNADALNHADPRLVSIAPVVGVTAGDRHTCSLNQNSTVFCWGDGSLGQRGDGTTTSGLPGNPVSLSSGSVLSGVVQLSAGGDHTCAVTSSGLAYCWGYGALGQLGNGATATSTRAVPVGTWQTIYYTGKGGVPYPGGQQFVQLTNVARIDAGSYHTCATLLDGTVRCWGYNGWGQLGDGTYTQRSSPVAVAGLGGAQNVSVGMTTSCAVRSGEPRVACWGSNAWGQFGDGTFTSSAVPRYATLGLTGGVQPAVGLSHACYASDSQNLARCAGSNAAGAFGALAGSSPTFVVTQIAEVRGISAGESFTCWTNDDRTVLCSGRNARGQLGQPSLADSTLPLAVQSLHAPASAL